jgi:hypothetical protein
MEKITYTHCKNPKCSKRLPNPSTSVHYCRNNNKCKNDYNNSRREAKVVLAEYVMALADKSREYKRILEKLLKNKIINTITIDELELMGIELNNELIELNCYTDDITYIEFRFETFRLSYFVMRDKVSIWRGKVAA